MKLRDAGELAAEIAESCSSEEEFYQKVCEETLPQGNELTEDDLELVTGGMSTARAVKIVTRAYWDLCVKNKKSTIYSSEEIQEAMDKCNRFHRDLLRYTGPLKLKSL